MPIMVTTGALILSVATSTATEQERSDSQLEDFSNYLDLPKKSVADDTSTESPLAIESNEEQTTLSIETDTLISPYLGAVKKREPPDLMTPHLGRRTNNPLDNYHLETGVGLKFNKQTEINLGYRFQDSQHLLDTPMDDASSDNGGDIRFSFEIKLPF